MKSIYDAYAPSLADREQRKYEIFTQVIEIFKAECERLDADIADDIEMRLDDRIDPHIWEPVKKLIDKFETSTLLTIFESTLMTIKRREKILKGRKNAEALEVPQGETTLDL